MLCPRQSQGFQADECDGLGLDFSQASRCHVGIAHSVIGLRCVPQNDVRDLMKPGLLRQFSDR